MYKYTREKSHERLYKSVLNRFKPSSTSHLYNFDTDSALFHNTHKIPEPVGRFPDFPVEL